MQIIKRIYFSLRSVRTVIGDPYIHLTPKFSSKYKKISKNLADEALFDKGMVDMSLRLHKKGFIPAPLHFNMVMGVNGGISGTPPDLLFMVESIPADATFTVCGVGRAEFPMVTLSILLGGHARVGFEENVYLAKGQMAKSNGELVAKVVRIAKELGREIATLGEARQILGLKGL